VLPLPEAIPGGLNECERCLTPVVVPVQWHADDAEHWWIRLRCGACGFVRDVVVTDEVARRFDREVERGMREIAAVLRRLERARMAAEVEALTQALRLDLLDAEDFGARRDR
jgi:hypothetical protein